MAAILPVDRSPVADITAAVDRVRVTSERAGTAAAATPPAHASKVAEAFRQFESFVLQSFIETMLPKNAESVFGKGTAGSVWKSMLAEKLADQISRNGGIGIAQRIAASHGTQVSPESLEASGKSASTAVPPSVSLLSTPERGDDV